MPQPSLLKIPEACDELRCGKSKLYDLAKEGKIRLLKMGGTTLIARSDIERFIASLTAE